MVKVEMGNSSHSNRMYVYHFNIHILSYRQAFSLCEKEVIIGIEIGMLCLHANANTSNIQYIINS